ncbi:hypothetical protein P692DRAFT_201809032 [Suillus brevipes Sb2]|nr:hypothetical protein P692DRAFT_201809032 [Suillus brevipes Sb2]
MEDGSFGRQKEQTFGVAGEGDRERNKTKPKHTGEIKGGDGGPGELKEDREVDEDSKMHTAPVADLSALSTQQLVANMRMTRRTNIIRQLERIDGQLKTGHNDIVNYGQLASSYQYHMLLTRNTYESNGDNSIELKEYDRDSDRREKRRGEENKQGKEQGREEVIISVPCVFPIYYYLTWS